MNKEVMEADVNQLGRNTAVAEVFEEKGRLPLPRGIRKLKLIPEDMCAMVLHLNSSLR